MRAIVSEEQPAGASLGASPPRSRPGWTIFLSASMVLVVCIRFFSENLGLVPGIVQFVDVPLTSLVVLFAVLDFVRVGHEKRGAVLRVVLYVFLLLILASALVNAWRIDTWPVVLFSFGFMAPLIYGAATVGAGLSRENVRSIALVFFWLGVLQLALGLFYGLPLFLATRNPDYVSGTFGRNCYQFTYFLGLWFLYVLGQTAVRREEPKRGLSVAVGGSAIVVFILFYTAQYRAMMLFFTVVLVLTLWASPARLSSRVLVSFLIVAVSVVSLLAIGTAFPNLKLLRVFDLFKDSTPVVQSGKIEVARNILRMYEEMPHTVFLGSGPGTFSSRAYITFADKPDPHKDTAGPLAVGLRGGQQYGTDVAARYVAPIKAAPIQGGTTLSSPKSSYTSLAAEIGPFGLLAYLVPYWSALAFSYRRLAACVRGGDSLGARLAFACFGGIILLLIQAAFDNWLETTRVTIPLWILIGALYALERADERADVVDSEPCLPDPSGAERNVHA